MDQLQDVISRVKPYLTDYLKEKGYEPDHTGKYKCIHPEHDDSNPSMGIINGEVFHCFGCNCTGNILHAAHWLEGLPINGKEFLVENLKYIAEKYSVSMPEIELTDKDQYKMFAYNVYQQASSILNGYNNYDFTKEKGWNKDVCKQLHIGTVDSWEDFEEKLKRNAGITKQAIKEIGITRRLFNEYCITFTVFDHNGRPVGFAARDIRYDSMVESDAPNNPQISKWVNTSDVCPIYEKSAILYGFHYAKNRGGATYIFEGYGDYVTAFQNGMKSCVALCGTSFTQQQKDLLQRYNMTDIIICKDYDKNGEGQKSAIRDIDKYFASNPDMKIRVVDWSASEEAIQMLEEKDCNSVDPDLFIYEHGIKEFKFIPKISAFELKLRTLDTDLSDEEKCKQVIPIIVNDQSPISQSVKAAQLSELVDYRISKADIMDEVKLKQKMASREVKKRQDKVKAEFDKNWEHMNPEERLESVESFKQSIQLEVDVKPLSGKRVLIDQLDELSTMIMDNKLGEIKLSTGEPAIDEAFNGGFDKNGTYIAFPGVSNIGKSSFMVWLTMKMLMEHDEDTKFLVFTIDDYTSEFYMKMLAAISGVRIDDLFDTEKLNEQEIFAVKDAMNMVTNRWVDAEERLWIKDCNEGITTGFIERWLQHVRTSWDGNLVFVLDNFHKLRGPHEPRIQCKHDSNALMRFANKYSTIILATMELNKVGYDREPGLGDISEARNMEYDIKAGMFIQQEFHTNKRTHKRWPDDTEENPENVIKPINEFQVLKNKAAGFKGILQARFDPARCRFHFDTNEYEAGFDDASTGNFVNSKGEKIAEYNYIRENSQPSPNEFDEEYWK